MSNNEETGKWVILHFFYQDPVDVYGLFDSEQQARAYAQEQGFDMHGGAYAVHMVLNKDYTEQFDPVAMGWVGKDGRP